MTRPSVNVEWRFRRFCVVETDDVREVEVERKQTAVLSNTCFEDKLVAGAIKALGEDGSTSWPGSGKGAPIENRSSRQA